MRENSRSLVEGAHCHPTQRPGPLGHQVPAAAEIRPRHQAELLPLPRRFARLVQSRLIFFASLPSELARRGADFGPGGREPVPQRSWPRVMAVAPSTRLRLLCASRAMGVATGVMWPKALVPRGRDCEAWVASWPPQAGRASPCPIRYGRRGSSGWRGSLRPEQTMAGVVRGRARGTSGAVGAATGACAVRAGAAAAATGAGDGTALLMGGARSEKGRGRPKIGSCSWFRRLRGGCAARSCGARSELCSPEQGRARSKHLGAALSRRPQRTGGRVGALFLDGVDESE